MPKNKEKADEPGSSKEAKTTKVGDLLKELIDASDKSSLKAVARKAKKPRKPR